jgi:hypothetical protein
MSVAQDLIRHLLIRDIVDAIIQREKRGDFSFFKDILKRYETLSEVWNFYRDSTDNQRLYVWPVGVANDNRRET